MKPLRFLMNLPFLLGIPSGSRQSKTYSAKPMVLDGVLIWRILDSLEMTTPSPRGNFHLKKLESDHADIVVVQSTGIMNANILGKVTGQSGLI